MNPYELWFGLFALFGMAVVAPAWIYFTGPPLDGLPLHIQFLTSALLPLTAAIMVASWLQPG